MIQRKQRVRARIRHKSARPRLSVFVSNKHIYVQIIDDNQGKTLASARDLSTQSGRGVDIAKDVGKTIAVEALKVGIKEVVFDRGNYKYHGRIKALAESAREGGLSF